MKNEKIAQCTVTQKERKQITQPTKLFRQMNQQEKLASGLKKQTED